MKILTPATTANIGPGFDIFGLSYKYYDEFLVRPSNAFNMKNTDDKYNNEENLFFTAYKKVANALNIKEDKKCEVILENHYPFFRGLGSSAALIVAGAYAANNIYKEEIKKELTKDEIFKICTEIEGHPDNVAPCIYGGVNVSYIENDKIHRKQFFVNEKLHATVFIPSYETSTEEARRILKKEVNLKDAIKNVAHSIFLIDALVEGDLEKLKFAIEDTFHVPYRKNLIKDYDALKELCESIDKNNAFTISGSGSTCVCFSYEPVGATIKTVGAATEDVGAASCRPTEAECFPYNRDIKVLDLEFDKEGTKIIV